MFHLLERTCLHSTETGLMSPGTSKAGVLGKGQSLTTQAGGQQRKMMVMHLGMTITADGPLATSCHEIHAKAAGAPCLVTD